jgi:hypothetical protein
MSGTSQLVPSHGSQGFSMFAGKLSCETAFPFKSPTMRFEGGWNEARTKAMVENSRRTSLPILKMATKEFSMKRVHIHAGSDLFLGVAKNGSRSDLFSPSFKIF